MKKEENIKGECNYSLEDLKKAWLDGRNGETETVGSFPFYKTEFKNKTFEQWLKQFNNKKNNLK